MPRIANLTIENFQDRIDRFALKYVNDWDLWLKTQADSRPQMLGMILRKWQACRPNKMRRTQAENQHETPYLDDLISQASQHIKTLESFEIRTSSSLSPLNCQALVKLWDIFQNLSYRGRARNGLSGIVGISKATLLLSNGKVGPAFDSRVRRNLGLANISSAEEWINALHTVSRDIQEFETNNQTTLQQAAPSRYSCLQSGRIYDMALGPSQ